MKVFFQRALLIDGMLKGLHKASIASAAQDDPQAYMRVRQSRVGDARLRSILGDALAQ